MAAGPTAVVNASVVGAVAECRRWTSVWWGFPGDRFAAPRVRDIGTGNQPRPPPALETVGRNYEWAVAPTAPAWRREGDAPHPVYLSGGPLSADRIQVGVEEEYVSAGLTRLPANAGFTLARLTVRSGKPRLLGCASPAYIVDGGRCKARR